VRANRNETILVAEDDDSVRQLIRSILEPLGYSVISARNAEEAIELFLNKKPCHIDLLLSDIRMSNINGIELAGRFRKLYPQSKVLLISGYAGDGFNRVEDLAAEYSFLAKPFSAGRLIQAVDGLLGVPGGKQTVLVVDDDEQIREFLRCVLEGQGYIVAEAIHGKHALSLIKKDHMDIVITDLVMPEFEGMETIPQLKRVAPRLKIIAMSGKGRGSGYLEGARLLGADATIEKPLEIDQLLSLVRSLLREEPVRQNRTRQLFEGGPECTG
jgi:DNA-binding NtrC family response regulator